MRQRFSQRTAGELTGFAVAAPGDVNVAGQPVWYGGGKLAADLTLPILRHRWAGADGSVRSPSAPHPLDGRHLSARTKRAVLRTTVRRAADEARTTTEFLDQLQDCGLLLKVRYSQQVSGQITGYAVALPTEPADAEQAWYSGSRLADDLSLTRLQQRWAAPTAFHVPSTGHNDLTTEERQAFYDDAARAAAYATAQMRRHLATNPYTVQDACWAASDALHTAAQATGNQHLRRAAYTYDRAARAPHGRLPRPTPAGNAVRTAARLLALTGSVQNRTTVSALMLVANLITLLDTIAELRRLQSRQAQADAARKAAAQVREAKLPANTPQPTAQAAMPSQARLAMAAFPDPWAPLPTTPGRPAPSSPSAPPRPGRQRR